MINPISRTTSISKTAPLQPLPRPATLQATIAGEQVQISTTRPDLKELAKALQQATLGRRGTDEAAVFRILGSLRSSVEAQQLDKAFQTLCGKSIPTVLKAELSGTQLTKVTHG